MAKNESAFWKVFATFVVALVVGGLAGAYLFPVEKTVTKEVVKEVPVEVPVEVTKEVKVADATEYLKIAKEKAFEEILDDYRNGYRRGDIAWDDFEDEWTVTFTEDGWTVHFEGTVEYYDVHDKDYIDYSFGVSYDEEDDEYDVDVEEL